MSDTETPLKEKFASGARWTVGIRLVDRGLGLASTLLLARLLTPDDFGIIAMGTSVQAILLAFAEFGFTQAIIQSRSAERAECDTAWTLNIAASAVVALLLLASIPLAVEWYNEPRAGYVVAALALFTVLSSFRNVGLALCEREMDFRPIFLLALARKLSSIVAAAVAAVIWANFWALLAGFLAGTLADLLLSYRVSSYRPRFSLATARSLLGFSGWWAAINVVGIVGRRGQEFLVGRQASAQALGQYVVAYEFGTLPTTEIVSPVSRAVLPGYVKLRERRDQLYSAFARVWGAVALLSLPAAAGIYCLSALITQVVLGPKWAGTEELLGLLAFLGAVQAMGSTFWPLLLAIRGPKVIFVLGLINVVMSIPAFAFLLANYGLNHAVIGLIITSSLWMVLPVGWLAVREGFPALALLAPLIRPVIATGLMVAVLRWAVPASLFGASWSGELVALLAGVVVGAGTYATGLVALWLLAGRPAGAEWDVLEVMPAPARWRSFMASRS